MSVLSASTETLGYWRIRLMSFQREGLYDVRESTIPLDCTQLPINGEGRAIESPKRFLIQAGREIISSLVYHRFLYLRRP